MVYVREIIVSEKSQISIIFPDKKSEKLMAEAFVMWNSHDDCIEQKPYQGHWQLLFRPKLSDQGCWDVAT
jgi:hypothetical protein